MAENEAPPPSYAQATGRSDQTRDATLSQQHNQPSRKEVDDDQLPLPQGWIRQHDRNHDHFYYVDTATAPPRSIWHHPYLDEEYLSNLSLEERHRVRRLIDPSEDSLPTSEKMNSSSEANAKLDGGASSSDIQIAKGTTSTTAQSSQQDKESFGRRMKNKLTGSTHAEREQYRLQRRQQEERLVAEQMHLRAAIDRAESSGQPQHIGKDRNGRNIYVEPSYATQPYQTGGYGPLGRVNGYPGSRAQQYPSLGGPYGDPNARFVRVQRGGSFGGGYGLPIAGGLLGGLLLGGLLAAPF